MKKEEIYTNMNTDFLYTGMEDFYSTEKSLPYTIELEKQILTRINN